MMEMPLPPQKVLDHFVRVVPELAKIFEAQGTDWSDWIEELRMSESNGQGIPNEKRVIAQAIGIAQDEVLKRVHNWLGVQHRAGLINATVMTPEVLLTENNNKTLTLEIHLLSSSGALNGMAAHDSTDANYKPIRKARRVTWIYKQTGVLMDGLFAELEEHFAAVGES